MVAAPTGSLVTQPKTIEQHLREGTFRPSRHGDRRQAVAVVAAKPKTRPKMPPGLTTEMKEVWRELVDALAAGEQLDRSDAGLIECATVMIVRARNARAAVDRDGLLVPGTKKDLIPHPGLLIERQALEQLLGVASSLGLSPVARARLGMPLSRR